MMHPNLRNDLKSLPSLLDRTRRFALEYLADLDHLPTGAESPVLPAFLPLPEEGYGAETALDLYRRRFGHLMLASAGPRYWGYVTGGTTPAALAGDWLAGVFDQNTQSAVNPGDVSAVVEFETMELLRQLFGLPEDFEGGFVTGATMSNFTCLGVARQWAGRRLGRDIAREGVTAGIRVLAATPHSSAIKALAMLGLGSANLIKVNTLPDREAVDVEDLRRHLDDLRGQPCIFIASGGTVNTVDFDDMTALATLKKEYGFWWHIDAAFGGFAAASPAYRHLLSGWEAADSITVDCHKWLNVPYDSAFFLVRREHSRLQVETYQNTNAPYLGDPLENFSYLNFLPENSRRFRALPAWFSLMAYGRGGYRTIVENNVRLAQKLGEALEESPHFRLLAPVRLNVVCFTLKEPHAEPAAVARFTRELVRRGVVLMTPTTYADTAGLRAALVNWRTTDRDVEIALAELEEVYQLL